MFRKKILLYIIILGLVIFMPANLETANASATQDKMNELKSKEQKLEKEIRQIDHKISENDQEIFKKETEVKDAKEDIEKLKKEIAVIQKRIEERDKLLKERVRYMYQSGGPVDFIEVLLGAQDFGDFVERISALNSIAEQDKTILEEHMSDKEELEMKKTEVANELEEVETNLEELKKLQKELDNQIENKKKLLKDVNMEEDELHMELETDISTEQNTAIETEKKRPSRGNGSFIYPAAGRVSSNFGDRSLGNHFGIDIAKSGTVPVHAAASGTVAKSYYSSSYGNVVFITHNIKGQTYTTVYAHMRSRMVSTGQSVSQGQRIGTMGNTGRSFGQHLHFELHKGQWNNSKSNAVNPIPYLK
ncbi:murein hydrolase activator EnvC family protein [Pseudalkalibacillus caeni]|uniref:murein hydrolase activator EnvC family protein n=1 Tax=Exobacillus caeni TaxID=2574798 RepID=UPI001FEB5FD1|nr:M23 family metallopeptidase [Pseudalkalibacillus caeni]